MSANLWKPEKRIAKTNGKQVQERYVYREEVKDDGEGKPVESIVAALKKPRMRGVVINLCYQVFTNLLFCQLLSASFCTVFHSSY